MLAQVFLILLVSTFSKQDGTGISEDAKLLVPELIRKYGYPCETHRVVSKDGYILEMHRIPYGKRGPSENRPAVYLQHGILSSSADWILANSPGFGYVLADAGYDVWMPNVRGTRYSRKHVALDPDKDPEKFWNFSWHDIGVDDVPSMIDYVIETVKQPQIFYIGHSQGTTVFYVMCSERPEYNQKIRAMFSLAPVAYMQYVTSPLMRVIALAEGGLGFLLNLIGLYEFLPQSSFFAKVREDAFCRDESIFQPLCTNPLFAILGFNAERMNASFIPIVMGHTPAGASTKQFLHYAQEVNSGHFGQYDYGFFGNLNKYESPFPPKYNLTNVKAPVYLYYSLNDWFSNVKDVNRLYRELGNVQGKFTSPDNKFNHVDYLYGIDAPHLLYGRVLGLMKRHL